MIIALEKCTIHTELFTKKQLNQICLALIDNIDPSDFADPDYSWRQMREIRYGLISKVDVSKYTNPNFSVWKMRSIRYDLEQEQHSVKISI